MDSPVDSYGWLFWHKIEIFKFTLSCYAWVYLENKIHKQNMMKNVIYGLCDIFLSICTSQVSQTLTLYTSVSPTAHIM